MPYWFKHTPNGQSYPVASGPYKTREEALAAQMDYQNPPSGSPPVDSGEVIEAGNNYPRTLTRILSRMVRGDGTEILILTDGSELPI